MNKAHTTATPPTNGRGNTSDKRAMAAYWACIGVYVCALAWPLGAYQRVLGPLHLHHVALAPVAVSTLLDWMHHRRLRTPFELWWPCALMAGMLVALPVLGGMEATWRAPALCMVAVAIAHVMRNRSMALRGLQLFVMSCGVMMGLSVLAQANWLYPTAFNVDSGLVVAGPYDVRSGLVTAVIGLFVLVPLVAAAWKREFAPGKRGVIAWGWLPVMIAVYWYVSPRPDLLVLRPAHNLFLFPAVVVLLVLLWLIARVGAKLWLARRFMPPGVYGWFIVALFVGTVVVLFLAPPVSLGLVLVVTLIAAYGQPYVAAEVHARRPVFVAVLITVALVLVNVLFVLPGDPRNYERYARSALARDELEELRTHLDFIKGFAPNETRADYYIARAWLAENQLMAATQAFGRALRDVSTRLMPPPDLKLVTGFLNEMRDRSSALPESLRGLAYEQALIHAGRDSHALSLLELRGDETEPYVMAKWPLSMALAALLDAPHLREDFEAWDAGTLAAILASAGPENEILPAPTGFPAELLPMVAMARAAGHEEDYILVTSPVGMAGGMRITAPPRPVFADVALGFETPGWRSWRQDKDGVWTLTYGMIAVLKIDNAPEILFRPYPAQPKAQDGDLWNIRIYVPDGK